MFHSRLNQRHEQGMIRPVVTFALVCVLILVFVPYFVFGKVVPPDTIGLRQNLFGVPFVLKKGFQESGLEPGLQWQIPMLSQVILLPRDFKSIDYQAEAREGDYAAGDLLVPTTDGSKVKTNVTLVVRLFERPELYQTQPETPVLETGKGDIHGEGTVEAPKPVITKRSHGGPQELIANYSPSQAAILEKVSQIAENGIRQQLSELSTADYYNPLLREKAALRAQDDIAKALAPDGIELWATLILRYTYVEQKIDDQIFAKNLQDQMERLNAASSRLAAARANTERERANWDAKIKSLEVEGQTKAQVVESEGRLYEASKKAEGDFLVAKARAEVDAARAQVLNAATDGAENYVAREMAPLVRTLAGGVVSNVDPYDVDRWVERFTGKKSHEK